MTFRELCNSNIEKGDWNEDTLITARVIGYSGETIGWHAASAETMRACFGGYTVYHSSDKFCVVIGACF